MICAAKRPASPNWDAPGDSEARSEDTGRLAGACEAVCKELFYDVLLKANERLAMEVIAEASLAVNFERAEETKKLSEEVEKLEVRARFGPDASARAMRRSRPRVACVCAC